MTATIAQEHALAHYGPMAMQADQSRRATDSLDGRRAAMRKAIRELRSAELAVNTPHAQGTPEEEGALFARLCEAEMAVERLLAEMR